jgi:hypothetical protein
MEAALSDEKMKKFAVMLNNNLRVQNKESAAR